MGVRRVGADGDVHGDRRGGCDRPRTAGWRRRNAGSAICFEMTAERFAEARLRQSSEMPRYNLAAGFFGGAETAIGKHGFDIFAGLAGDGDFEIVDRGGAVQRKGGGVAAAHEIDQNGRQAALDDVAAESPEDHLLAGARAAPAHRRRRGTNRPPGCAEANRASAATPPPVYGFAKCSTRTLPPRAWMGIGLQAVESSSGS